MKVRINDNTISSVSACVYPTLNDTGVEIASVYLLSGFVRASVKINESAPRLNRQTSYICLIIKFSGKIYTIFDTI